MKTLFPAQEKAVKLLVSSIIERGSALNSSCTGSGKTVMACAVARKLHCPIAVIAPKATLPSWKRELAEWGIEPVFVTNYEKIRNGSAHLKKVTKKIMRWDLPEDTLVVFDECQRCVKEGALVTMSDGSLRPIEDVKADDFVLTPLGPKRVTSSAFTGIKHVVLVSFAGGSVECTHDHKLFTQRGWVEAGKLKDTDYLCLHGLRGAPKGSERKEHSMPPVLCKNQTQSSLEGVPMLWQNFSGEAFKNGNSEFLLPLMCLKSHARSGVSGREEAPVRKHEAPISNPPGVCRAVRKDEWGQQPHEVSRDSEKGIQGTNWGFPTAPDGWERDWHDRTTGEVTEGSRFFVGPRICGVGPRAPRGMAPHASGLGFSREEDRCRSGRVVSQHAQSEGEGSEKRPASSRGGLESTPYQEFRSGGRFKRVRFTGARVLQVTPVPGEHNCYDISVKQAECFYANGVLVHNCKSPFTQSSQLLISAKMQGVRTLLLSATAAEDPTEMRAIGYALELHGLNRGTELLPNWDKWMKSFGCFQDQWKNWRPGPVKKLLPLHDRLYKDRAVRITERDLPEAFRENWVLEDPIEFGAVSKIKKFYEDAGVTTEVIDELMDHMDTFDKEDRAKARDKDAKVTMLLTRMLRARQLTEALKVPDIVEMTKDMIEEHKSVVIFVNFRETLDALVPALEATLKMEVGFVNGGQNAEERQDYVDRFRDDKLRVIVLNSEAGGTGIDGLQDTHGTFPRVSLISLSFNAKTFKQVLGRIHRANSKSDALQKILIASGTIEEYVLKAIHKKLSNLEALHGT